MERSIRIANYYEGCLLTGDDVAGSMYSTCLVFHLEPVELRNHLTKAKLHNRR